MLLHIQILHLDIIFIISEINFNEAFYVVINEDSIDVCLHASNIVNKCLMISIQEPQLCPFLLSIIIIVATFMELLMLVLVLTKICLLVRATAMHLQQCTQIHMESDVGLVS